MNKRWLFSIRHAVMKLKIMENQNEKIVVTQSEVHHSFMYDLFWMLDQSMFIFCLLWSSTHKDIIFAYAWF